MHSKGAVFPSPTRLIRRLSRLEHDDPIPTRPNPTPTSHETQKRNACWAPRTTLALCPFGDQPFKQHPSLHGRLGLVLANFPHTSLFHHLSSLPGRRLIAFTTPPHPPFDRYAIHPLLLVQLGVGGRSDLESSHAPPVEHEQQHQQPAARNASAPPSTRRTAPAATARAWLTAVRHASRPTAATASSARAWPLTTWRAALTPCTSLGMLCCARAGSTRPSSSTASS